MNLNDVIFILFKHKWKIMLSSAIGFTIAAWYFTSTKVPYVSSASLLIRYVKEKTSVVSLDEGERARVGDQRSETLVMTEMVIMTSLDLAREVAAEFGPEKLLRPYPSVSDHLLDSAAAVIKTNLLVAPSGRTSIIDITFKHPDREVTQPVLDLVVARYLKRHTEIHRAIGQQEDLLTQETDKLRVMLAETEEELRKARDKAGISSAEDARLSYGNQITSLRQLIREAEAELAERRAALAEYTGQPREVGTANVEPASSAPIPETKRSLYQAVVARLGMLRQREHELLLQFTTETEMVRGLQAQIAETIAEKSQLEKEFPALLAIPMAATPATTGAERMPMTFDVPAERARVRAIESRIGVLIEQLDAIKTEAAAVSEMTTSITELQRRKDQQQHQYEAFNKNLEQAKLDERIASGTISNISVIQASSPPRREASKLASMAGGIAFGGIALGIALAFALELYLDQSVKRPREIEGSLGLPLFMAIPDLGRAGRKQLGGRSPLALLGGGPATKGPARKGTTEVVPWAVNHGLRRYFEALRDGLIYNFEMRNITRKPKLVAVTSCGEKTGVSTIAAGLAATLSETGDGNVLLVDMNPDRSAPQFFHRGDLKVGLDEALEEAKRDDAMVQENLYVVSSAQRDDRLSWILPKRFANLVPKLKASDYDYIIFDMPAISQLSPTHQLARFMDQVLLVAESEESDRASLKRAADALKETGVSFGVVLNKTHDYLPRRMQPDALDS